MTDVQKPHVTVVPFPAPGHYIPFIDLSRLLASHGLTVSYVTTLANVSLVKRLIPQHLDIRLVVLPTPTVEGLPQGRESADLLPRELGSTILKLVAKLQPSFTSWMEQQFQHKECPAGGTPPPVCIIYDLFIGWAVEIAEKFGIASFRFQTCGAFATSLLYSISASLLQNRELEKEGESAVLRLNLPLPLRFHRHEIAVDFFDADMSNPNFLLLLGRFLSMNQSSGMLINTFYELEPAYVQNLKTLTGKPIWAIGPVLPPDVYGGASKVSGRGKMADVKEAELVRWLDSQRPRSIVYVSFGSLNTLSELQTRALAIGIEASGQPFVWAIKVPQTIESLTSDFEDLTSRYLTKGFEERTKGRGLVIWGWAPQLLILSHASVGAFMSHCGWNSTLESIAGGVPILAWPMFGDQHFDAKLLSELGMGIQFCQHRDGLPDERKVEKVIKLVLTEEKGKEMTRTAAKLKEMAKKALHKGGSSKTDLQDFVNEMHKLNTIRSG